MNNTQDYWTTPVEGALPASDGEVTLPATLMTDPRVQPSDVATYMALTMCEYREGAVEKATLMKYLGKSQNTVARYLASLEDLGYLNRKQDTAGVWAYELVPYPLKGGVSHV